jgi:hypothetical protein
MLPKILKILNNYWLQQIFFTRNEIVVKERDGFARKVVRLGTSANFATGETSAGTLVI